MISIRRSFTETHKKSTRHVRKQRPSTKSKTDKKKQPDNLKMMIVKELMRAIPDDLTKFKLFELKFETKSVYLESKKF